MVQGPKFEVFGTSTPERRTSDRAYRAWLGGSLWFIWLIWSVLFIWLIWFIWLVSINQKNQTDQTTVFYC